MPTVCELSAGFEDSLDALFDTFFNNLDEASRWGTRWDVVRDEQLLTLGDDPVRQVWGFTTAYARMDGMGGHVTFLIKFVAYARTTEIRVVVTSPYEKNGRNSAYYQRNHQVALRLLEFCVAPYEEIHPRIGTLQRLLGGLRREPARSTT
jgi:hypothetical protein